jgi:hypothetical protein
MKIRSAVAPLLLAAALVPAALLAQGDKAKPAAPPAMGGPEMEAMMKAMSPGEHHKPLQRYVGDWTYSMKMWMAPGLPAAESSGTVHAESILGGRYVQSVYKGQFIGQPFEGRSTDGYDNLAKQYVSSWVDNAGTGIMNSTGSCEGACKSLTYTASSMDPMSGKKIDTKQVITWLDDNHYKMEMFMLNPGGEPVKSMEVDAKRK